MVDPVSLKINARSSDLGGFSVRRLLPSVRQRSVGPFVFLDHIGPSRFPPGDGINVRPHPHIGLATVTYLFSGEILHRDSLGFVQPIRPGDVNWMVAGSGIVHSERTRPEVRAAGQLLHGLQSWLALPQAMAESAPAFSHHPAATLPEQQIDGGHIRVILGTAFGMTSPVPTHSPMFYAAAELQEGGTFSMPCEHAERAVYVSAGAIRLEDAEYAAGDLLVLHPDVPVRIAATEAAQLMLLGGAPLDGPRLLWWNFVATDKARIERAKEDWRAGRFATIPEETDFIPLPES